ncbi:DNA helicase-4 [Pseudobutyrivibrio sp. OR37]|uniref:UvrD-helicase domain-containing protein n=1 Tax=Pseudobutyrivibrio sp. OR37 TaxID=1798186 RepID=UPI0008E66F32|nr:UvrD-helicase domain-containing protein [Pseudobutyrivibrio sp. OR37]SFH58236.1 DNA helicase-4 [Pseudobutyrivibrio sp. OR37]
MGLFSSFIKSLFPTPENKYIEQEKTLHKALFDNIDGRSLDDNQRTAVVDDSPRQLVVAGAGSGKTLTISAKVKYLVDVKGVAPEDILLISFTKKAADEMHERIKRLGIDIDSSTFHKYGLGILTEVDKKQPDVVDNISDYLDKYLNEIIFSDERKAKEFLSLIGLMMLPISSEETTVGDKIQMENLQNFTTLRDMARGSEKRTLRNERVKSGEEVYLANRFYLDGIDYEYEAAYPYDEIDNYRKKYRPDFYLKEFDVYWEHFGVNKNNRAPQYDKFHEQQYIEGMKWKRELHTKNHTKLAETFSWQFRGDEIDNAIKANYAKYGVKTKPVSYQDIIAQIEDNNKYSQFSNFKSLVVTFVSLYRSYGYNIDHFSLIQNEAKRGNFIPKNYDVNWKKKCSLLFLEFVKGFYEYYINELTSEGMIDFNDMIIKASDYISQGLYKPAYKYVIIDEFQDISYSRYMLVKNTLDASGAKLFCVGDDWQSIYRFSGSDIDLFINFKRYFGSVSRTDITKTYRNSQELIDISARFILQNKYQLHKSLRSDKHQECPIRIVYYAGSFEPIIDGNDDFAAKNVGQALDLALEDINKNADGTKMDVLVLGRINNDINMLSDNPNISINQIGGEMRILHKLYPDLKITFRTVHSSKGLEADQVIVLNLLNGELGFPSQIIDDPILSLIQTNQESYLYAEERRLFYVALTRTKNCTYLLSPEINESIFVKAIEELKHSYEVKVIVPDNNVNAFIKKPVLQHCPICKAGILSIRQANNGRKFVSCSNYPKCSYANWDLAAARNNIRCPECGDFLVQRRGKYGIFLGCSGYPACKYTKNLDK